MASTSHSSLPLLSHASWSTCVLVKLLEKRKKKKKKLLCSTKCRSVAGFFPSSYKACPAFLRHKMTIISPTVLKQFSIPFNKVSAVSCANVSNKCVRSRVCVCERGRGGGVVSVLKHQCCIV